MHTGLSSKYNLSHKIHYGRKQPLTRILLCGSPGKQRIDPCGIEQIVQHATGHHTDRSLCHKRLEHLAQRNRHLCASLQESRMVSNNSPPPLIVTLTPLGYIAPRSKGTWYFPKVYGIIAKAVQCLSMCFNSLPYLHL